MRISLITILVIIEIGALATAYCFGAWGLTTDRALAATVHELTQSLDQAKQREQLFQNRLDRWLEDEDFSVEKMARERLHMIKPGDIVYRTE